MNKLELKEALLQKEYQTIKESEMHYEEFLSSNLLDRTELIDTDDQSHHRASLDISDNLDHQIHNHEEHLKVLNETDFSPTNVVKPGAVVKVNDRFMIIAVSKPLFEWKKQQYIGISPNAPIYSCLKGKKVGDTCQFNNIKFVIQEIN